MSREIKFRAWDKTNKVMIKEYAHIGDGGELYVTQFHRTAYSSDGCPDLVLMQYTGLKDKNGNEIYEGDIIKNFYYNSKNLVVVKYLEKSGRDILYNGFEVPSKDCEIIGNKPENPELLEKL